MSIPFTITHLDHLVLTVRDLEKTRAFYTTVLGMKAVTFGENRHALVFGSQKINLHAHTHMFSPRAAVPQPGSGDLCLITPGPLSAVIDHLKSLNVPIVAGPVPKTGARSPLESIYITDPDGNLVEVAVEQA